MGPAHQRADLRRRFLREARAASAANHPNVVDVLDVFELDDGTPVMVMELLSGETLRDKLVRERTLSLEATASILLPVIAAVGTAHALGIVHRDLKPENIFLLKGAEPGVDVKVPSSPCATAKLRKQIQSPARGPRWARLATWRRSRQRATRPSTAERTSGRWG
jgi:hypothetical protein